MLDIVVAGAVLMELAFEGRIDTDLERLVVADATPLDDDLLDPALADIAAGPDSRSADFWLARTATRGEAIRELHLPGWERARVEIENYLGGLSGYRENRYEFDPGTVELVRRECQFALDFWGYPPPDSPSAVASEGSP